MKTLLLSFALLFPCFEAPSFNDTSVEISQQEYEIVQKGTSAGQMAAFQFNIFAEYDGVQQTWKVSQETHDASVSAYEDPCHDAFWKFAFWSGYVSAIEVIRAMVNPLDSEFQAKLYDLWLGGQEQVNYWSNQVKILCA